MRLSRPAFYSALGSCLAHSVALGFAATLIVSEPHGPSHLITVTLFQRAIPLPVSDDGGAGKSTPRAIEQPAPALPVPPQPAPQSVAKPRPPRSASAQVARARMQRPRTSAPLLESAQPPQAPPIQMAAINPAAVIEASPGDASGAPSNAPGDETRTRQSGAGTKAENGGNAAQPDYGVNPKPPYPMLARRLGAQGVVLLRIQVREDGSVATVEIARSSGFTMLDDAATRTVRDSWRFIPARVDGAPIASWVEVPIRFVLENS